MSSAKIRARSKTTKSANVRAMNQPHVFFCCVAMRTAATAITSSMSVAMSWRRIRDLHITYIFRSGIKHCGLGAGGSKSIRYNQIWQCPLPLFAKYRWWYSSAR